MDSVVCTKYRYISKYHGIYQSAMDALSLYHVAWVVSPTIVYISLYSPVEKIMYLPISHLRLSFPAALPWIHNHPSL